MSREKWPKHEPVTSERDHPAERGVVQGRRMLAILLGSSAVVGGIVLGARITFDRRIAREAEALLAEARPAKSRTISESDLERLPEPVQRWLRYSNVVGTAVPRTGRLRQKGQFHMKGRAWVPFEAEQYFTIEPPGFLWKATFRMAPGVWVTGRDRYRGGEGSIDMRLLSLITVAANIGGGLNQGALLRFLGELQWFPAAMLADYISWESVDSNAARATMTFGGIAASMVFRFALDGRLVECTATRYNDSRVRNEQWVNRNDSDQQFDGIRVPDTGEARWEYDTGPYSYIRWRITAIEPDRPGRFAR